MSKAKKIVETAEAAPTEVIQEEAGLTVNDVVDLLMSGGDDIGNGLTNALFVIHQVDGAMNLTSFLKKYNTATHMTNRYKSLFRNNKRLQVGWGNPTMVVRKGAL